ncbi:MAG: hypothetical protein LBG52_08755 [Candidatus Peribacteria bacterium]|nr:hypothetical protein [Candidatus Peribacteria bacterium]
MRKFEPIAPLSPSSINSILTSWKSRNLHYVKKFNVWKTRNVRTMACLVLVPKPLQTSQP